ncbi:MAG: DUF6064 family protein [Thermoanaerobaculia bacterium]
MSEWWTYRPSDFLLFSSQTYYRLFELYNAAIWPAQVVAVVLAIGILLLLRRPAEGQGRLVAGILAAFWLWIAIRFHLRRYATINWAAVYFAWAFGLEAALLIWTGIVRRGLEFAPRADRVGRIGVGIFLFALFIAPLIGPLLGRSWGQVEILGVAPDPTAVATLGLLLAVSGRVRWELLLIPLGWCAVSGATLWTLGAPDKWVMPVAGLAAGTLGIWKTLTWRRLSHRIP